MKYISWLLLPAMYSDVGLLRCLRRTLAICKILRNAPLGGSAVCVCVCLVNVLHVYMCLRLYGHIGVQACVHAMCWFDPYLRPHGTGSLCDEGAHLTNFEGVLSKNISLAP